MIWPGFILAAAAVPGSDWLQYGAIGLLGLLIFFGFLLVKSYLDKRPVPSNGPKVLPSPWSEAEKTTLIAKVEELEKRLKDIGHYTFDVREIVSHEVDGEYTIRVGKPLREAIQGMARGLEDLSRDLRAFIDASGKHQENRMKLQRGIAQRVIRIEEHVSGGKRSSAGH